MQSYCLGLLIKLAFLFFSLHGTGQRILNFEKREDERKKAQQAIVNGDGKLAQPNRMMEQPQNGRANRKRGGSGRRHTTTAMLRINGSRRCLPRYLRRCVQPCLMVMFVVLQLQLTLLYMDVTANFEPDFETQYDHDFEPDFETQYDHPHRRRKHRRRRSNDGGSRIGGIDPSFSNAEIDMMTTIVQLERQRWQQRMQHLPILLVGGSDGSGTRGVVDVLMNELYVDFIVEDRTTLDVHGQQMFSGEGWPKLVTTTLQATNGSLLYDYKTLPSETKTVINDNVHKLIQSLQRQQFMTLKDRQLHKMIHTAIKHSHQQEPQPQPQTQPQQQEKKKTKKAYDRKTQQNEHNNNTHETTVVTDYTNTNTNRTISPGLKNQNNRIFALQQHILETLIPNQEAATVSYGFKAPATMLLLPLFTAIMRDLYKHNRNATTVANHHDNNDHPKVKFIHVVRE